MNSKNVLQRLIYTFFRINNNSCLDLSGNEFFKLLNARSLCFLLILKRNAPSFFAENKLNCSGKIRKKFIMPCSKISSIKYLIRFFSFTLIILIVLYGISNKNVYQGRLEVSIPDKHKFMRKGN